MLSAATEAPLLLAEGEMTEGGMVDASRPGYRQVAARLREQILSGADGFRPGDQLKSHAALAAEIAAEHGVDAVSNATINAAVSQLAAEGLVRVGHGRPTIVLERHRYHAEVIAPWAGEDGKLGTALAALSRIPGVFAAGGSPAVTAWLDVDAADAAQAVARAWEALFPALAAGGWDVAGAAVSARPA